MCPSNPYAPWREVEFLLTEVEINPGESIELALKKFKKRIQKAGTMSEIKRRERYEKPSEKRKRKREAAVRRARKFANKRPG